LGLVAVLTLWLIATELAFFFFNENFADERQLIHAADAGTLNAAHAMLPVNVSSASAPVEFQGLAVKEGQQ
jgi:hypothetical protein